MRFQVRSSKESVGMKTERRHELQENELASWVGDAINKIQPYGRILAGLAVLAAVAFFVSSYLGSRNEEARQEAWAAYYQALAAGDAADFQKVAETFPGTVAAGWSLQSAGDMLLNEGVGSLFRDREEAKKQLEAAREIYKAVGDSYNDEMLQQRAMIGLAKTEESLGNFDAARKSYEQVTKRWSDSEMSDLAAKRLAALDQPETQQWYDWFAQQTPVTSPLESSDFLNDISNLPGSPDVSSPGPGELLSPGGQGADGQASDSSTSPGSGAEITLPSDLTGGNLNEGGTDSSGQSPLKLDLDTDPPTPGTDNNDSSADASDLQLNLPSSETPSEAAAEELNLDIPQP